MPNPDEQHQERPRMARPFDSGAMNAEVPAPHSILLRLWMWIPDWFFRVVGVFTFLAFIQPRLRTYITNFWSVGAWFQSNVRDPSTRITLPWTQVLVDMTYLLIATAFLIRTPPLKRASRPREILLPVMAAFWPFLPFMIETVGVVSHSEWGNWFSGFLNSNSITLQRFIIGSGLIILGNALDVYGYATLLRSLSIVAEARVLKVHGPYRLVRHPVYLGQMMAQAGVWLFFHDLHVVWVLFWAAFVSLQLYRSTIEEDVLERAFGDTYRSYKRHTFWFVGGGG